MIRLLTVLGAAAALAAPTALHAACPRNAPKPTTVNGQRVKPGSCGPFMMKADDISNAYYDCKDMKGKPVRATYKDCTQLNAKPDKKPAAQKGAAQKG